MNKNHALRNLLNNTASEEEIALLKQLLATEEISIGGNVSNSVIILGSGNTMEITSEALDSLGARPLLGNLDRELTAEEIAAGLRRLDKLLPNRAPVLLLHYKDQVGRLRAHLKTETKALSEPARRERVEALAAINSICLEAVDISFNGLCLGDEAPNYEARCPFRGLESFRVEDREFFFGREELTQKLVGKIQAHSFLAILGASGSGKSSLVMAGVIPALDSDYVIFRPGTKPLDELESARGKSLIVVDQFEELFTLTRDEAARKEFIARLLDEATRARIILTLRSDFLGEAGAYRSLSGEIQNHLEIIPPMNADELRRAMEGQARWARLEFEADLSQQILDDVAGEPGAMPLLQHALWELWNRRHGRQLRAHEYRAFGGVKQAITSTAEKVYSECSKPEQEQVRDIFLRLTRLDEGDEGRDTRRRVPLGDLIPYGADAASISTLLDKLANARLIVKTVNDDVTEIEVAHEALIRHWERLRIWLNEDRDNLRLRESVSESAKEWEKSGRHESLLNSRWVKLDEALLLAQDSRYRLTEIEGAYLKACVGLRNREQRERERRLRYTMFASIVAAIIFLALGSFGWFKNNEAEKQAKVALAHQLALQAQIIGSGNELYNLLLIESLKVAPSVDTANILLENLGSEFNIRKEFESYMVSNLFSPNGKRIVSGTEDGKIIVWSAITGYEISHMIHEGGVISLAFSPDSSLIASGGYYGTARVWDVSSGKEISRVAHGNVNIPSLPPSFKGLMRDSGLIVKSIVFSPDGKFFVSGSGDCTARVWEATTGKEITRMTHSGGVNSVAFSPDGRYIVSGSDDGTARIWEAMTGMEIARMIHDSSLNGWVNSVAFSPDGRYIVSGSDDGTARIWEAITGKEIARMTHDGSMSGSVISWVNLVAFSPDGRYVVSGSNDKTARVWDAVTGKEVSRMTHDGSVNSVAFSPNGRFVASGSSDGNVRVWEALTGNEIIRVNHQSSIVSVGFSPNNDLILSGDAKGSARVWPWQLNELLAYACVTESRNLTRDEWQKYIGDALPYQAVCPNRPIEE